MYTDYDKYVCETILFDVASDVSGKARLFCKVGINEHLRRKMDVKNLRISPFWFFNYIKNELLASCNNSDEVNITVYLYFPHKFETLSEEFVNSNIAKYCANKHAATHFVRSVEYGAEFVLWMHKPIGPSKETKETAEEALRLALKTYLRQCFYPDPNAAVLGDVLKSMTCSFLSSIRNCQMRNGTFMQCIRFIKEMINTEKNDSQHIWRSTRMQLCRIPATVDIEIANDLHLDIAFNLNVSRQRIEQKSRRLARLIESPSLRRVPFLKTLLVEFIKLLKPITSTINETVDGLRGKYFSKEQYSSITKPYVKLLGNMLHWLKFLKRNMEKYDLVLKENSLQVLDLRSIKEASKWNYGDFKTVKVFVLHFNCVINTPDERFKEWTMYPNTNPPIFNVQIGFPCDIAWEKIHEEFKGFLKEANSASNGVHYVVGILSPNSPYEEGSVFTMNHEENTVPICLPKPPPIAVDKPINSCAVENEFPSVTNGQDCVTNNSSECQSNALSDAKSKETERVSAGFRICEEFARTDGKHCQLLSSRPPNIFLLNVQYVFGHIRWYELGSPSQEMNQPVDHKVILLMGATECGKTTLINAMVNYFLGVRWNDSFRFKIVCEDFPGKRTSSVSAYTIHHKPGMAVPYSVTIIDTPGYGNRRGVGTDMEITSSIHEFLTFNQFDRVMKIHAACFVSTYDESQLTKSQRYIIDSMLTIFGTDIKEKIQLLVTFANGDDPPVVQAFLNANFPASSHSVGISYYKFNSFLLYQDNSFEEFDEDGCIQEYFWELERKNFEKFFGKLKSMDGHTVKPIGRVVKSRDVVKQPTKKVEEVAIKEECEDGMFAYNCRACQKTCEKPVFISKAKIAKDSGRQCKPLNCRCKASDHCYQNFVWIYKRV